MNPHNPWEQKKSYIEVCIELIQEHEMINLDIVIFYYDLFQRPLDIHSSVKNSN